MHPKNKNILIKRRFWVAILVAQFLLFYIFSKISFIISFFNWFFETKKTTFQKTFSIFSFSVGDILYTLTLLLVIFYVIYFLKKKNRCITNIFILINIFYFTFQLTWGMLYFQKPIILALPNDATTENETKKLVLKYLNLCREARKHVKEDKNGIFEIKNLEKIKEDVINSQKNIPKEFSNKKITQINNFKPSLFGKILSYTGIMGYYNPFTTEAQYNPNLPSTYLPFTIAHESAHQLGFAREEEANFIGFLITENSQNKEITYSNKLFVLKSLLKSLIEKDPEFVGQVKLFFSPEMTRDIENDKKFVKKHQGFMNSFFGTTNDLFLKSNQQEGSVSYNYFVDLLIKYERLK